MAVLRVLCTLTWLLTALIAGTAGGFQSRKDRATRTKLHAHTANKAADYSYGPPTCTAGAPQFPNYIPPMKIDPKRMMGKWYYYMDPIPDEGITVNKLTIFTNLVGDTLTLYPGSNIPAIAIEQLYGVYSLSQNQCNTTVTAYLDYVTAEGKQIGIGFVNGQAALIDTSLVMSTDYDTYALFFECDKYDVSSGICADPYPYVLTRIRPDQVSTTAANTIVSAINQAFGAYCFTVDMMVKYVWRSDKPECPVVPATDSCYVSVRDAYKYLADPNFSG